MLTQFDQLKLLSDEERNQLETVLLYFEQDWHCEKLQTTVASLHGKPLELRRIAVWQLIQIDIERCQQVGQKRQLEQYQNVLHDLDFAPDELKLAHGSTAAFDSGETNAHGSWTLVAGERLRELRNTDSADFPIEFGRYTLLAKLGEGAMGIVYRAHDSRLHREVALKIPKPDVEYRRFQLEGQSAARLRHQHICPVLEAGDHGGKPFITMPLLPAKTLADVIRSSGLDQIECAELVRKIAIAVQHAHSRGVTHRDLKPTNVMIDELGEPMVVDFGLAYAESDRATRLTKCGQLLGTPAYVSPEQLQGEDVGPGCDIYSLGVVFYELLTGKVPFQGNLQSVTTQILTQDEAQIAEALSGIHRSLNGVCCKMMARDAADRYATMQEAADSLRDAITESATIASGGGEPRATIVASSEASPREIQSNGNLRFDGSAKKIGQPLPDTQPTPDDPSPSPWRQSVALLVIALLAIAVWAIGNVSSDATVELEISGMDRPLNVRVGRDKTTTFIDPRDGKAIEVAVGMTGSSEGTLQVQKQGFMPETAAFSLRSNDGRYLKVTLRPIDTIISGKVGDLRFIRRGRVLQVWGTPKNDLVELRVRRGRVIARINGIRQERTWLHGPEGVHKLVFYGGDGDDRLITTREKGHFISVHFEGGAGHDTASIAFLDGQHRLGDDVESVVYSDFGGSPISDHNTGGESRINQYDICEQRATCHLAPCLAAIGYASELNGKHDFSNSILSKGNYLYLVRLFLPQAKGKPIQLQAKMETGENITQLVPTWITVRFEDVKSDDLRPIIRSRNLMAWPTIVNRAFNKTPESQKTPKGDIARLMMILTGQKGRYFPVVNDSVLEQMSLVLGEQAKEATTVQIVIATYKSRAYAVLGVDKEYVQVFSTWSVPPASQPRWIEVKGNVKAVRRVDFKRDWKSITVHPLSSRWRRE